MQGSRRGTGNQRHDDWEMEVPSSEKRLKGWGSASEQRRLRENRVRSKIHEGRGEGKCRTVVYQIPQYWNQRALNDTSRR